MEKVQNVGTNNAFTPKKEKDSPVITSLVVCELGQVW